MVTKSMRWDGAAKQVARALVRVALLLAATGQATAQSSTSLVTSRTVGNGFSLFSDGHAAPIVHDRGDAALVGHAVIDLADDLEEVTGIRPSVTDGSEPIAKTAVIIGTLGNSATVDRIVAAGKVDVTSLRGAWESYIIATVKRPLPGVGQALLVIGSDRRGTAYGVYELSAASGISPWRWWADVAPERRERLVVLPGVHKFGSPSVKYRGIFINDEDWGLIPWASKTFDPADGNFGPKTYRKVFQLLLRLKANTLWPAMHRTSRPFNAVEENARLADEYGIVMGSSHAEPMLRNNVGEWTDAPDRFNYATNAAGVRSYWQARVASNARFESLWTLGMRGIHDSGMAGGATTAAKVALLGQIIADQRAMLSSTGSAAPYGTPQVFMPYKEVLTLYRLGLKVPEDVTLMWPDDNFGYIRQFPTGTERTRTGGAGVYYHLSYLGAPLSYLWLSTTPPALVQEEMVRAWDQGARQIWILNVGDIKPGEVGISHFFDLAWDIGAARNRSQSTFLADWSRRTFGPEGNAIGAVLDEYFRLNFERRPEHLQWWLPGERPRWSDLTPAMADERLRRFDALEAAVAAAGARIPKRLQDAFFELVAYPVQASTAANWRYFAAERYAQLIDTRPSLARSAAGAALEADARIKALTKRFNEELAGGKWRRIMAEEPADNQWAIFRTSPIALPAVGSANSSEEFRRFVASSKAPEATVFEAEDAPRAPGWRFVSGLGRGRGALIAGPGAGAINIPVRVPPGAPRRLRLGLLPFYPLEADGGALKIEISVDGAAPLLVELPRRTETPDWAHAVLDNLVYAELPSMLPAGPHRISVTARSSGIALDRADLPRSEATGAGHH